MTEPALLDSKLLALVEGSRHGVLATIAADGRPQLSNVLYAWDAAQRTARISTTAGRAKGRNLRRDPRAALHVSGDHFWQFAVAEGPVTLSEVAAEPRDAATMELLAVHSSFFGPPADEQAFFTQMILEQRVVARLQVTRIYGIALEKPPGT